VRFRGPAFLLVLLVNAFPGVPNATAQDMPPQPIADLIQQLGDAKFAIRDGAARKLHSLGETALPALRVAAEDDNLEIRIRAENLVKSIIEAACRSKSTGLELVSLAAGEFEMGSPKTEPGRQADETQHRAAVTKPFLLGKYEVTQSEYEKVMKTRPSWFAKGAPGADEVKGQDTSRYPVERVSWFDALEFCNKLSALDGYPQFYKLDDVQRADGAIRKATVSLAGGSGYRLPTETEWEYACRAKTTTPYYYGARLTDRQANAKGITNTSYGLISNGLGRTTSVGAYLPNAWGLYDMHGNAGEWCWDWYDRDGYAAAPPKDSQGPAKGVHRVVRGGSWLVNATSCRSASRFWLPPSERSYLAGFRVARAP